MKAKITGTVNKKNDPRWMFFSFEDGLQQWFMAGPNGYHIERVLKPYSRRKRWVVVDRQLGKRASYSLYASVFAGPFPNLKAAMVAYEFIASEG